MEKNEFASFIAYFRQLATEHRQLAGSFVHGPVRRIVEGGRSGLRYPLLWLETPALILKEKDGTDPSGRRECAFLVLINSSSKKETDAEQDATWARAERIALDVISRMRRDKKRRLFSFTGNITLEPVNTLTVSNEYGWRVEFELEQPAGLCYDASQWQEGGCATC